MSKDNFGVEKKTWHFFRYQELVIDDELLDAYDKSAYGAICKYADSNTGVCHPSLSTLAKKAGCSKPRLVKSINKLIEAGYIKKRKRIDNETGCNKSNIYKVVELSYISNALKHAKDNDNKKVYENIKKRLEKHPIPTYEEVIEIVNNVNKGSKRDLQGVVNDINHPSKRDLHELEPINENHINKKEEEEESCVRILQIYQKVFNRVISSYQFELIQSYLDDGFEEEVIILAIKEAGLNNADGFSYVKVILDDWLSKGLTIYEQAENYLKKRKLKHKSKGGKKNGSSEQPDSATKEKNYTEGAPAGFFVTDSTKAF